MLGRILDSFSKTKQSQRISIRGKCDFPLIFEKSRKIDEKILRRRHYNCFTVFEMDSESFCYGIKTFEKLFYHPQIILHRYDGSYIAKNNPQMAKYEEMSCFAKFITLLPVC